MWNPENSCQRSDWLRGKKKSESQWKLRPETDSTVAAFAYPENSVDAVEKHEYRFFIVNMTT